MGQPPIICIVDDDADVRASLKSFLRSAGVDVQVFENAREFLTSADGRRVDCLITDLHMEGMDGLELQAELRHRKLPIPVVMMTAFPTPETRERSIELGALAYLAKPVDPEMLLDRVEGILARG